MKYVIAIMAGIVLVACGKSVDSGSAIAVVNGDFEQVASDSSIPGWTIQQHAGPPSYEMVVDAQGAYAGHGGFRMTRTQDQVYGTLSQDVAIAGAAGATVELSAMVKTKDVGPEGWKLMISGDRVREFSPAMTGTSDWHRVTVRAQLPPGASSVTIAATLLDGGSGWMDDVQLRAIAR